MTALNIHPGNGGAWKFPRASFDLSEPVKTFIARGGPSKAPSLSPPTRKTTGAEPTTPEPPESKSPAASAVARDYTRNITHIKIQILSLFSPTSLEGVWFGVPQI